MPFCSGGPYTKDYSILAGVCIRYDHWEEFQSWELPPQGIIAQVLPQPGAPVSCEYGGLPSIQGLFCTPRYKAPFYGGSQKPLLLEGLTGPLKAIRLSTCTFVVAKK